MKFDDSQIDRIERDIAPPMKEVITIPAGEPLDGFVVYVGRHAFGAGRSQAAELKAIARQIVASGELLEALKEMREVCAACFRVIATFEGATDALDAELKRIAAVEGFGERASKAIAKAEGRS